MSNTNKSGWIAVDLDGTVATYGKWMGVDHIGAPIPRMIARIQAWLAEGREVKIFTARVHGHGAWIFGEGCRNAMNRYERLKHAPAGMAVTKEIEAIEAEWMVDAITPIENWCEKHIGRKLEVTNVKDFAMLELWDDRAIQVEMNTGERVGDLLVAGGRDESQADEIESDGDTSLEDPQPGDDLGEPTKCATQHDYENLADRMCGYSAHTVVEAILNYLERPDCSSSARRHLLLHLNKQPDRQIGRVKLKNPEDKQRYHDLGQQLIRDPGNKAIVAELESLEQPST